MLLIFKLSGGQMAIAETNGTIGEAHNELMSQLSANPETADLHIEAVFQAVDPSLLEDIQTTQKNFNKESARNLVDLSLRNIRLLAEVQKLTAAAQQREEQQAQDDISLVATALLWQQGINIETLDNDALVQSMQSAEAFMTGMGQGIVQQREERAANQNGKDIAGE